MAITESGEGRGPLLWRRSGTCSVPPTAPHLQMGADARTTMAVSWATFGPVRNPTLELAGGDAVPADSRTVRGTPTVYHHAIATGLRPGSIHQYRLTHDGAAGRPRTLRTADDRPTPFTFTAFGDQGVSDRALLLSALVRRLSPAFHLHAGDLSYAEPDGLGTTGARHPERWDLWRTMVSAALSEQAPWMPVVGNHEIEAGCGQHGSDGGVRRWTSLFDRHAVDLVVTGHNHCYERTHALRHGEVATAIDAGDEIDAGGGTVYVTAGGGGGDGHDGWVPEGSQVRMPGGDIRPEAAPWSATRKIGPSLLAVDVDPAGTGGATGPSMRLRALRTDGSEIERITLVRRARRLPSPTVHRPARRWPPVVQTRPVA